MQSKKYLSMLGLARRAGKLSMGHDTVLDSIKKRKSYLIVFSSDISDRAKLEIEKASERYMKNVPCIAVEETMNEIDFALGYKVGILSVDDINFAKRITELINLGI